MSDKIPIDIRDLMTTLMKQMDKEQFMNMIDVFNGNNNLIIDGKVLSEEELKAVVAFVRLMRQSKWKL